jgi:DegV family protein with EDD domain
MRRTAETTGLVYDSTAELPDGVAGGVASRMVPMLVQFGSETFRDHVDQTSEELYARLAASPIAPTTSQAPPAAFAAAYEELLATHDHVISLHLSGKLSGTVQSARLGAEAFGDRVTVIDTGTVSVLLGLAVIGVAELLARGTDDDEVGAYLARHAAEGRLFVGLETLEHLQRGGRIGKAQALVGQLLSVRPILTVQDGEILPLTRVRGTGKVVGAIVEQLELGFAGRTDIRLLVGHGAAPEGAERLVEAIAAARPDLAPARVVTIGAAVGAHAGPGAIGVAVSPLP